MIELIGIYSMDREPDVVLIELSVHVLNNEFDIGEVTQEQIGIDRLSWQTPWDGKYLNKEGTEIIGYWLEEPKFKSETTRFVFFMHFLDFNKPLITQFGKIDLNESESMPKPLSSIIQYEKPD